MPSLVLVGLAACGSRESSPTNIEEGAASVPPAAVPSTPPVSKPNYLDAQGRLKGSGRKVDWFEIPAGFSERPSRTRHHLFVSQDVTMAQLRDYLGARMLTGQVDELGEGAIYRAVMPLSAADGAMRFDVQVAAIDRGAGVSVALEERTFLGAPPLSPAAAAKVLAEEQARAE